MDKAARRHVLAGVAEGDLMFDDPPNQTLGRECRELLLGDRLGGGIAREVFECRVNDRYVVKVENGSYSFQNITEWEVWNWLRGGPFERWLAPCDRISPCGLLLLQRRVTPMRPNERPKKIPRILTDIKEENFGVLDGKVVCCDYGTIWHRISQYPRVMMRANWK